MGYRRNISSSCFDSDVSATDIVEVKVFLCSLESHTIFHFSTASRVFIESFDKNDAAHVAMESSRRNMLQLLSSFTCVQELQTLARPYSNPKAHGRFRYEFLQRKPILNFSALDSIRDQIVSTKLLIGEVARL